MKSRLEFFRQFLTHPAEIGSVIPSSIFLERRVVRAADLASARTIVELGPGTGGTTRAILRAMHPQARLLTIEINPRFHELTKRIDDRRLIAHLGSAADLQSALDAHGLPQPDVVISGIPFSTMGRDLGRRVMDAVFAALTSGGRFVAYQFKPQVAQFASAAFPGVGRVELELLNVPPMRVYRWQKDRPSLAA
jgi:phospholipid N-methyltransferase